MLGASSALLTRGPLWGEPEKVLFWIVEVQGRVVKVARLSTRISSSAKLARREGVSNACTEGIKLVSAKTSHYSQGLVKANTPSNIHEIAVD